MPVGNSSKTWTTIWSVLAEKHQGRADAMITWSVLAEKHQGQLDATITWSVLVEKHLGRSDTSITNNKQQFYFTFSYD